MGTETLSIQLPGYDCYDDPNWTDEALKQCRHKGCSWLYCDSCCNQDICRQLEEPITIDFGTVYNHLVCSIPTYDEIWTELQPPPSNTSVEYWSF